MQKNPVKPKQKKKNIQTGIIMGQNTNVFSQLSATFLQKKGSTTQVEQTFLKNTQIVQYHDPNINRLIALLRKKAEVTKIKAVLELHEQINKLNPEQVEQFITTFAQLYLEIILNEPSKQITEQFAAIFNDLIATHKKTVVSEISTLYPPLLLSHKLPKLASLLFSGNDEELASKALLLLLKKEVRKKFVVMVKLIMDCEAKQKIVQPQYQRNCQALMRIVKQFIRLFDKNEKAQQLSAEFNQFLKDICDCLGEDCLDEYFKVGGKAKASILQLYSSFVSLAARKPEWQIVWQPYSKAIGANFLDKDPLVQQSLWRGSVHTWLQSLLQLQTREVKEKEQNPLLNIFLPKSDQKLLQALKVGGFTLYKQLTRFCQIFPHTTFFAHDSHKQLVNKLNFCRKLLTGLLGEEDQNQARMECYAGLTQLIIERVRGIALPTEEKKCKEVQSLVGKLERQAFQNLQQRYYKQPPTSKNYFSHYIPQQFTTLINTLQPNFQFKFNPQHTFSLYQGLTPSPHTQNIIDTIFESSKLSQTLILKYLQAFPARQVQLDMTDANPEAQIAAKIFLLTSPLPQGKQEQWLLPNWDIRKQIIAFDPRISQRDLDTEEDDDQNVHTLYFRPTQRNPLPLYDRPQLDATRFGYFQACLLDDQRAHLVRYLIPLMADVLVPRNPLFINKLLELYVERSKKADEGKWAVGAHEVLVVRVLSQLISEAIIKERGLKAFNKQNVQAFLQGFCQFVRLLTAYKMQAETQDLLRRAQALLVVEQARPHLFLSCQKAIKKASQSLLAGGGQGAQKIRKNRIKKCLDLITKLLWHCLPRNDHSLSLQIATEFIKEEGSWKQALTRSEPWHLSHVLLASVQSEGLGKMSKYLLQNWDQSLYQISLLLSSQCLLPLQALPDIRKTFVSLKNLLQRGILDLQDEPKKALLFSLIQKTIKQQTLILEQGIKSLITFLLLQNEEDSTVLLSQLRTSIVVAPFQKFIKLGQNINQILIYTAVLSSVPLKRIEQAEQICCQLTGELVAAEGIHFLMLLAGCCLFWNKGVGSAQATSNDSSLLKTVISKALLAYNHQTTVTSKANVNFAIYSLFSLVNVAVGLAGRAVLGEHQQRIEQLFWETVQQGTELETLAQGVKMRYASRAVLSAGEQSLNLMLRKLPQIIRQELGLYRELMLVLQGQEELNLHENVTSLFVEAAEFLLRAAAFVDDQRAPQQQTLVQLVQCPFPALKKSAFLLLKTMYQRKLVKREPPVPMLTSLKLQLKGELNNQMCSLAAGYFYVWQLLLVRRQATERVPLGQQQLPLSLQDIIQGEGISELLIRNCFFILQDLLDYTKNESDYPLSPEQLLQQDQQADFLQQGETQQRMFRLVVRTLFLFVTNFPIFLRDYMDRFKKHKNMCERLLRNVISEAIFREEVGRIEVMEPQWKAGGNFEIYVTPKNKEIYAQYTHDVIRIGLRLVMRGSYPLTPVAIQFGQGLKIEDGSRWGLMLQSQLHNRNNTLINGILLWKENIDKKLSGVEECSICFDIVNASGQLPKKGCKTCKKKFHGNCIMKWFTKSNKSECPLCKSQFL